MITRTWESKTDPRSCTLASSGARDPITLSAILEGKEIFCITSPFNEVPQLTWRGPEPCTHPWRVIHRALHRAVALMTEHSTHRHEIMERLTFAVTGLMGISVPQAAIIAILSPHYQGAQEHA